MDEFNKPIEEHREHGRITTKGAPLRVYREWKKQLEQIERALASAPTRPGYDPNSRYIGRLIEQKQHLEEKIAEEVDSLRRTHDAGRREFGFVSSVPSEPFTHSKDYISVKIQGADYTLTTGQAQMIEILHGAYKNGTPDVSIHNILERVGTPNSRWQDTWRSNKKARKALIKIGTRRGTLRLNL